MSDWSSRTGDSLCSFPQNLPAGIELKLEPSEEPSDPLRLLDSLDVLENWLDLALNEDDTEQEVLPISDPLPQLQYLPKSPLPRLPPIWAQSRQEVCESFEWFRSYQGGVYQNNGTVKGYFLSAFSANRDIFACGGKIVISHGGGRAATSRTQRGQTTNIAADDQRAHDLSVRALIETHRSNQPLVLLIDDKYEPFPFDLGSRDVYMAILGFYKIIHVWGKLHPSGRVIRYKFAFQWCEDQGEPWWLMGSSDSIPLEPDNLYSPCSTCLQKSPRVYQQAWACLKPVCPSFWITSTGRSLPDHLDYNPEFLSVIDFRPLPLAYRNALLPKPPVLEPKDGITTSYRYSRGWHCGNCGRLSSRSAWEHYECPNCKDTHAIVGNVRPANTLTSIRVPVTDKFVDSLIDPYSGALLFMFNHFDAEGATGRYQTFILPEEKGKIHLIQTNRMAKVEADRIFEAYQRQASDGTLLFRRWPLRSTKCRYRVLHLISVVHTQWCFVSAWPVPHELLFAKLCLTITQYVGGTSNTVPFDRAPSAVIQARKLIEKRILEALGVPYTFNEVLSAAYMEQQKMAGDVLVMEGAGVQDYYECVPCNFRIAATARLISPEHY
ncbi:hypothetical protein B0H15DRAFT_773342 [Mycena belliarum]|uniref:Uncharacterized protein n=1 Tax=Mycena belliarum TaxID=1033014 RepID=A0AAD6UCF9_9AGAR|nr:hypothetical protein B0H15DRAFT_773342 [Mycena belliae]